MKHPIRAGVVTLACLAAASAVTGCGVTGTDFRPGLAAQVEGTDIRTSDVDEIVTQVCAAQADSSEPDPAAGDEPSVIPRSAITTSLLQYLVEQAAWRQYIDASDADITFDPAYDTALASIEQDESANDDDEEAAGVAEANRAYVYGIFASVAVGTQLLTDEGNPPEPLQPGTDPTASPAAIRGQAALAEWLGDHDVELNPKYGLVVGESGLEPGDPADDELSVAVSDEATKALFDQAGDTAALTAAAEDLPQNLICG